MSRSDITLPQARGFGQTSRTDRWWVTPLLTFLGLSAFIVYATYRVFENKYMVLGAGGAHYLSPFFSPLIFEPGGDVPVGHAWFGALPGWWPSAIPYFPAMLVLWAPGGFRFTCYYYRGAYYKAFWMDPPSCSVGEPRKSFLGENSFPLILQNLHRFFLYFAVIFIFILIWDAWKGYWFTDAAGAKGFGVHVGSLVLTTNAILLGGYTLGCHSLRHLVGGGLDILSRRPVRKKTYDCVSCLNRGHMKWAWASLFWVAFTDFYIRMCAAGHWTDLRIFGA